MIFMDAEGTALGSSGYFPGGPEHWIKSADKILGKRSKAPAADVVDEAATLADAVSGSLFQAVEECLS